MMAALSNTRPRSEKRFLGGTGFVLVWIMGCQVIDLQPSQTMNLPPSLPRPKGMMESAPEEALAGNPSGNSPAPKTTNLPTGEANSSNKGRDASAGNPSEPIAKVAFNRPGEAATLESSATPGLNGNARGGSDLARAGMMAAAIPSDPPLPSPGIGSSTDPLVAVYRRSYDWFQGTQSFTCRMVRREVVGGRKRPEEMMAFQYRKQPYSIHLKWLGQEGKGRELVYIEGMYDNRIQIKLAGGDIPLVPAGKRMSFTLDNPLVRSSSRHSVQEASFGFLLATVGNLISQQKQGGGKQGTIQYVGKVAREDYGGTVEMIEIKLNPGAEEGLPHGGRRLVGFDPREGMPVLVQTFDETGQEVEYYRYDRFIMQGLDDHDFNPDELWAKPDLASKP